MTSHAADLALYFGDVGRVHHVLHWMPDNRMPEPDLDGKDHHFVLLVVVLGQLRFAVEDSQHVFGLERVRLRVRPMTFETQRLALRPQQVIIVAAVRLVTGRTSQAVGGLVQVCFLHALRLFAVAGQAGADWIGLKVAWALAGVRVMTGDTLALRTRMLHLGLLDLLALVAVAGLAKRAAVGVRQDHLAVFGRYVANVAGILREGRMHVRLEQLGGTRLMRIMTHDTARNWRRQTAGPDEP